jgi:hypothetical protein
MAPVAKRWLTAAFRPRQRRVRQQVQTRKETTTSLPMRLFAPDLYRSFALGFAAGAVLVAGATVDQWADQFAPPARAAETAPAAGDSIETLLATGQVQAD